MRRDGWRRRARRRAVRGGLGDFAENSKEGTPRSAALLFGTPLVSHTLHPFADLPVDATQHSNVEKSHCLNVQLRYHLCMAPQDHPLQSVDLRLLRIFQQVVRFNGFSAAQEPLGMTQATISAHMKQLEGRLGVRLCERGRSGFYLTEQGKQVHSAMLDLFGSIEGFQSAVGAARGGSRAPCISAPSMRCIATPTSIWPGRWLPSIGRPRRFRSSSTSRRRRRWHRVSSAAATTWSTPSRRSPANRTIDVFDEQQMLYCGPGHPLFEAPAEALTAAMVAEYPLRRDPT